MYYRRAIQLDPNVDIKESQNPGPTLSGKGMAIACVLSKSKAARQSWGNTKGCG